METLYAVVAVFVSAYNAFGAAKSRWRTTHLKGKFPFGLLDFLFDAFVHSLTFAPLFSENGYVILFFMAHGSRRGDEWDAI